MQFHGGRSSTETVRGRRLQRHEHGIKAEDEDGLAGPVGLDDKSPGWGKRVGRKEQGIKGKK